MKKIALILVILMIATSTWAAKVRTRSEDLNGDGMVDQISVFQLDSDGRVASATFDTDANGTVDRIQTVTRTATETTSEFRNAETNTLESSNKSTCDASGRLVSWVFDNDGNGQNDTTITNNYSGTGINNYVATFTSGARVTHTKTVAIDGDTITTSRDQGGDGTVDKIIVSTRDSRGRDILTNFDDDGDGSIDRVQTTAYSTYGSSYSEIRDATSNDLISTTTITNDSSYRELSHETDSDGDGIADSTIMYEYVGDGTDNFTITYQYEGVVKRITSIVETEE